jgi:glycosyltransferase involved in cell wall biosynthesis
LILLQFGNIDNRKNTENIIRALESIPQSKAAQISLLIVGKHAPGYADQLFALKSNDAQYQMISKNEFVADDIMEAIFAQSDVIIRMNVGFFGSSGVVGIAARHNKVCIVSDTGVMANEVTEYKLGKTVAPENIEGIKICLEEFLNDRNKTKIDGTAYIKSHNLESFAKTLLS